MSDTSVLEPERAAEAHAPCDRELESEELRELHRTWSRTPGFIGWIQSTDHKDIGLRFIVTALVFFVLAGILALLMRLQLARPQNTLLSPDLYNQLFTTHGTAMMFLFAVPVMEGMGLYLVPLMIGTRNVSFPRLMNFGYYLYLFAGVFLFVGLILNVGPDMGWFSYVPLAGPEYSPGKRVDVWSQMITLVETSTLVGAIEIIVTVLRQRAPGMSLDRMPLFVWTQFITSLMIIFAMPSVMLASTLLAMDRLTGINTHFFNQAEGSDPLLWQHLFWFFAHPEVYIIFIPATGFLSAMLPAFTRRPVFGYTAMVLSTAAVAFIGFGVWVHHMFTTPLPQLGQGMFTASSLLITIPNGLQIFCWLTTLWTGRPIFKTPFLFALGFLATFVMGGLTGVMLASVSIDRQVHDTFFVVAHLHYVLIGGAVFPLLGALYYWYPKWSGRMLNERLGVINFLLVFAGFHLTFFPMHQLGLQGMPRRVYTYIPQTGWGDLNLLATVGAFTLGLGVLSFLINAVWSMKNGQMAGNDPWGADTLEWATTSPPPTFNFAYPPTVRGRAPLWESPETAPVITGLATRVREMLVTTTHEARPDHRYHVSGDSIAPFIAAMVTGGMLVGLVFHPMAFVIGCILYVPVFAFWFWPTREPKLVHDPRSKESQDAAKSNEEKQHERRLP